LDHSNSPIFRPKKSTTRFSAKATSGPPLRISGPGIRTFRLRNLGTSPGKNWEKIDDSDGWIWEKKPGHLGILDDFRCHSQKKYAFPCWFCPFFTNFGTVEPQSSQGSDFLEYLQQQSHEITLLGSYPCTKQFLAMLTSMSIVGFSYFFRKSFPPSVWIHLNLVVNIYNLHTFKRRPKTSHKTHENDCWRDQVCSDWFPTRDKPCWNPDPDSTKVPLQSHQIPAFDGKFNTFSYVFPYPS